MIECCQLIESIELELPNKVSVSKTILFYVSMLKFLEKMLFNLRLMKSLG